MYTRTLVASVAVAITLLLSSCGGGGGGSDAPVPVPTVQTPPASSDIAVSGFVAKGTITGGVVRATQYVNGVATAVVREATLGPDGSFLLSMPRGVTLLQVIAGSDTKSKDEATGAQVPLPTDFIMRSIIDTTGLAAESAIAHITPFTELTTTVAQRFGGFVTGSVAAAQSGVASLIGADPATTKPIQIDILDSLKATAQEQRVSILNAAVSNIAAVGGMGCGDKATYGSQIGCVVSKISDGIELTASNTAQSTLKLGTQSFQEMAAAVAEIKNISSQVVSTVVNVLDTVKYVYSDDLAWNSAKQEVDSSIQDQIVSSRLYVYAHLSDLIYSVDPTASDSSIFTSASDSQSASLPSGWRVIDWSVFGSAARPSNYSASGLAFNVFVNAEIRQLVFAYRGTSPSGIAAFFQDMAANINNTVLCGQTPASEYAQALAAFDVFMVSFGSTKYKDYSIVTTGHSLGGGLASYIAIKRSGSVKLAMGFNSAPLCGIGGIWDEFRGKDPSTYTNVWHLVAKGEVVTWAALVGGFRPGRIDWIPAPVRVMTSIDAVQAHLMSNVLRVVDYARAKCAQANCDPAAIQVPSGPARLTSVSLDSSTLTINSAPSQGVINLSGAGLQNISKITISCTKPSGQICGSNGTVWTSADWGAKVDLISDTKMAIRPQLLGASDVGAYGTYIYSFAFEDWNGGKVSRVLRVEYPAPAVMLPALTDIASAAFDVGTKTITTTAPSLSPEILLVGVALDSVSQIDFRSSGATNGVETWKSSDSDWNAKVLSVSPSQIRLLKSVISPSITTAGDIVWSVSVSNSLGKSGYRSFSVSRGSQGTPAPAVTLISPTSMTASTTGQPLVITGINFAAGNVVQFKWGVGSGAGVWTTSGSPPTVNSSSQITVNMTPGSAADTIYVRVCSSGGATSCSSGTQAVTVTVVPASGSPQIAAITSGLVATNGAQTVAISGTNFVVSGASTTVTFRDPTGATYPCCVAGAPTISNSSIAAKPNFLGSRGTWSVKVTNSGGGDSGWYAFQVN